MCWSILAGLVRPDSGRAELDGRTLFAVPSGPGQPSTWVPAHDRGVALLAQEPLLFPHLSVLDNVALRTAEPRALPLRGAGRSPSGG